MAVMSRRAALGCLAPVFVLALAGCATTSSGEVGSEGMSPVTINRLLASPDRSLADREQDARRKPAEMLAFIGVRPGMTVLDVSAGKGYTSDLLARAVGPTGRVYGQSEPDHKPALMGERKVSGGVTFGPFYNKDSEHTSEQFLTERAKKRTTANIVPVVRPFEDPAPEELADGKLDLVTLMFNYHDMGHLGVDRAKLNEAVFKALKPGGLYVIADHAGRPGTGISESGTLHRIEESFLRQEVEAAGFKLAAEGQFLRNPADPRDGSPIAAKDEFVLKFVKP